MKTRLILASSSPRRRELLSTVGLEFDVIPSHIPEERTSQETAQEYVARLSREKASAIATVHPDRWVIAADTTVVAGEEMLEKPVDAADARRMLRIIAGTTHTVFTGVTVKRQASSYEDTRICETEVTILPLSDADIAWYVDSGEPLDKAGAYAAQGKGGVFIDSVNGSFTNVVGLPLALLLQMLRNAGIDPLQ